MNIVNPFKYIKDKDNLTYGELGKILGTSRQCIHQLANDVSKPSSKLLLTILVLYKEYFTPLDLLLYYHKNELSSQL